MDWDLAEVPAKKRTLVLERRMNRDIVMAQQSSAGLGQERRLLSDR